MLMSNAIVIVRNTFLTNPKPQRSVVPLFPREKPHIFENIFEVYPINAQEGGHAE